MSDEEKQFISSLNILNAVNFLINGTDRDLSNLNCSDKLKALDDISTELGLTLLGESATNGLKI